MTVRGDILATANKLTHGERNVNYGSPTSNMLAFASLLQGYFEARGFDSSSTIDSEDAAWIMVLAKMARTVDHSRPLHNDNYIDAAAYVAMAGECAADDRS